MPFSAQKLGSLVDPLFLVVAALFNSLAPILIRNTQDEENEYTYNRACFFFFAEVIKLAIAAVFCVLLKINQDPEAEKMIVSSDLFKRYLGLGFCFFAQNNLSLFSLKHFSTSGYMLMMNSRIVLIAVLSITVLGKRLNGVEWSAVLLITVGSVQHNVSRDSNANLRVPFEGLLVMLSCAGAAAIGNVYTQLVMQKSDQPIMFQNLQLYLAGVGFNGINWLLTVLVWKTEDEWLGKIDLSVVIAICFFAVYGLSISFVLKRFGALTRTLLGAVAIVLTGIWDYFIGTTMDIIDVCTYATIIIAVYLYSEMGPKINPPKS
ncbi:hypothetical protein CYMTET_28754 [Cymbomonas tetramitiformis]|uniref:Uncharacterized protein n=1 Tax=Cymbomonas tetramitiformis TaxID=36881 RepID=A0AAE0EYJ8_9CHLO|nr:hypothetical protein CYMTET_44909 [Cymbomonas tetramitiformis]KAK3246210.1 hypothetical protein CYMTET_44243 [Cymbomonas tetramitiformis]KAK3262392.1 hypothetical protein CYMTET_28754 [Cymbomonas tetramitiformis]